MIFSIIAFVTVVISLCIKDRKKSLYVQSINCICESIYDFIINAYTGAVLGLLNFIRTNLFIAKDKLNKTLYLIILILFELIIVINCIFTWHSYISLLPTVGSLIRTYCLWQVNMTLVRISGIISGLTYGIYYLYYHSWFMALGYLTLLITGIITVYINDIRKKA